MTGLIYLTDSYKNTLTTTLISFKKKGGVYRAQLKDTIFYPQSGGQPADSGTISGPRGRLHVTHVKMEQGEVMHTGELEGTLKEGETIMCEIDWERRYWNMRTHSAGHILHEVIMSTVPALTPAKGEHGQTPFIEYRGGINPKLKDTLEKQANMLVAAEKNIQTRFVTLEELKETASWVPPQLPQHKPLRIVQIEGYPSLPDGGTQIKNTKETGFIKISRITTVAALTRVYYQISQVSSPARHAQKTQVTPQTSPDLTLHNFQVLLLSIQNELMTNISQANQQELEPLKVKYFGAHGKAAQLIKRIKELGLGERKIAGQLTNAFKQSTEAAFSKQAATDSISEEWFDTSLPGIRPTEGHLHIVSQAIVDITRIFNKLGFTRVRHPEVDWDWYAFESLNMPPQHPARDEWETFFVDYPGRPKKTDSKKRQIVLTPHTSNGQVREMEKGKLPIRMINIAKCYRRQIDISHTPMFHQFEGLYIDRNVSIGHLKGVFDYFVKQFYGPKREIRLRPSHFQFTEPSFEVDITCGVCLGKGCRLCKAGWLELSGAGMVHPEVLKNGGVDPDTYTGFAFGWGIERTYMMKAGTQLNDIRLLYSNDLRFLSQF